MDQQEEIRQKENRAKVKAAQLSVLSNSALLVLKLVVGISIGSIAVLSEAIHSAIDLVASVIAFFAVRAADAPPDEDHPFGHGKIESLSGSVEALLIFGAGAFVLYEAIHGILHPRKAEAVGWGILVMAFSALTNFLITRRLFRVAKETESIALEADAHHLSTDIWTSVGVLTGLGLVYVTRMPILDSITAIAVGLFILRISFQISRDAIKPLIDVALPEEEVRVIEQVMRSDERVKGWHKLRTRRAGSWRHVDVHLLLADDLTFQASHDITEEVEEAIRGCLKNVSVTIHAEPYAAEVAHQIRDHDTEPTTVGPITSTF